MQRKSAAGALRNLSAVDLTQYLGGVRKIRARWSSGTFITVKAGARVFGSAVNEMLTGACNEALASEFRAAEEAEIRQEFQSRALQMTQGRLPANKWEWYF